MSRSVADILAHCLQAVERGEMTPAECLVHYPEQREELEALLNVAAALCSAPKAAPLPAFRQGATVRLLDQLPARTPPTIWDRLAGVFDMLGPPAPAQGLAVALIAIVAVVALLLGGSRAVSASDDALPGDRLYPVKTTVEDVRLTFSTDPDDIQLYLQFTEVRVQEMERLVHAGRSDAVPLAARRFEDQVREAKDVLARVSARDGALAGTLNARFGEGLSTRRASLERLLETAPEQARPSIQHALDGDDERDDADEQAPHQEKQQPGDRDRDTLGPGVESMQGEQKAGDDPDHDLDREKNLGDESEDRWHDDPGDGPGLAGEPDDERNGTVIGGDDTPHPDDRVRLEGEATDQADDDEDSRLDDGSRDQVEDGSDDGSHLDDAAPGDSGADDDSHLEDRVSPTPGVDSELEPERDHDLDHEPDGETDSGSGDHLGGDSPEHDPGSYTDGGSGTQGDGDDDHSGGDADPDHDSGTAPGGDDGSSPGSDSGSDQGSGDDLGGSSGSDHDSGDHSGDGGGDYPEHDVED